MLFFYFAKRSALPQLEAEGLHERHGREYQLWSSLPLARKQGKGIIVAVQTNIDGSWLSAALKSESITVSEVPRRCLLNIEPYRKPRAVTAAGGVFARMRDDECQVLLIHRRGKWDLPKGKKGREETIRECAIREVSEEIGIDPPTILRPLGKTMHGYPGTDRYYVKTTHWFAMHTEEVGFIPQRGEGIDMVKWIPIEDAIAKTAFPSLRTLLRETRSELLG
jgi:8-oxo-dGTP pyrophosphatase MutT (NUDIX family)